jgi:hypothetical protein
MADEAVSAGFYESPDKKKYPRIQLLTIEDLLSGKKIDMPPWAENRTFVKAPRAKLRKKTGKGLFPPGAEK